MKKTIIASIIILGISSITGQLLLIRELTISFYGNEFFIGWIFFSWLFWVGMGSLLLNKFVIKNIQKILIICHVLIGLLIPLEIFLARLSRIITTDLSGQIPNLIPSLAYTFFIIAPFSLILGLQFAIVGRFWKSINQKTGLSQIIGKTYALETLGFIIGGLCFSYFLIFINELQAALIVSFINFIIAGFLLFLIKKINPILKYLIIVLIFLSIGFSFFTKDINQQTNNFRFPNQKLIESKNSIYGNIAVTQIKEQYNFYESGLFLGSDKEEIFNEYLAHFSLLYHPEPKRILLIGSGFNGLINQIQKHKPDKIYYLELDPEFIKVVSKYIKLEEAEIINQDARYFLKNTNEGFDVIILNLPNPSTALINRFYTEDFFKEAKKHLNSQGILATYLSSSPNYLGPEVENLDASLFKSLKNTFNSVIILPEDNHFFISSQAKLGYGPEILIQRLKQRNIKTNFVNGAYIDYRLTNNRVQQVLKVLEENKTAKINQDQLPISYYYNSIYWVSLFYPGLANFFLVLAKIKFIWLIVLLIGILILSYSRVLSPKRENNTQKFFPLAMAIAGFSLMAAELIIIFGFQVFYGYLYYKLALIITILMVGMALGTWLGIKKINQVNIKSLIKIHFLIIIFSLILLLGFYFLFKTSPRPSIIIEILFLFMAGLIGGIVGYEFPIINKLYLQEKQKAFLRQGYGRQAGVIYGADLLGSCLGALLISVFFIPIFGIFQTLIFLIILNLFVIAPIFLLRKPVQ